MEVQHLKQMVREIVQTNNDLQCLEQNTVQTINDLEQALEGDQVSPRIVSTALNIIGRVHETVMKLCDEKDIKIVKNVTKDVKIEKNQDDVLANVKVLIKMLVDNENLAELLLQATIQGNMKTVQVLVAGIKRPRQVLTIDKTRLIQNKNSEKPSSLKNTKQEPVITSISEPKKSKDSLLNVTNFHEPVTTETIQIPVMHPKKVNEMEKAKQQSNIDIESDLIEVANPHKEKIDEIKRQAEHRKQFFEEQRRHPTENKLNSFQQSFQQSFQLAPNLTLSIHNEEIKAPNGSEAFQKMKQISSDINGTFNESFALISERKKVELSPKLLEASFKPFIPKSNYQVLPKYVSKFTTKPSAVDIPIQPPSIPNAKMQHLFVNESKIQSNAVDSKVLDRVNEYAKSLLQEKHMFKINQPQKANATQQPEQLIKLAPQNESMVSAINDTIQLNEDTILETEMFIQGNVRMQQYENNAANTTFNLDVSNFLK